MATVQIRDELKERLMTFVRETNSMISPKHTLTVESGPVTFVTREEYLAYMDSSPG